MVDVPFSLRSQFLLRYTVSAETILDSQYSQFTWTARMVTDGTNASRPYNLSATADNSNSNASVYVSGNNNDPFTWSYDYRSPTSTNASFTIGSGTRKFLRTLGSTTFSIDVYASPISGTSATIGRAQAEITVNITPSVSAPTAPTYLSASTDDPNGINLSWGGAGGSITNYGIWYSFSSTGAPSSSSSPDFTTTNTSYTTTVAAQGEAAYFWVRAQGPGGNSAWYPSGGTGVYGYRTFPTRTATFYNNDGTGGSTTRTGYSNTNYSVTTPVPSRSGYNFGGWYSASSGGSLLVGGGVSYTIPYDGIGLYANWTQAIVTPAWDSAGQVVTTPATLGIAYTAAGGATETVYASNMTGGNYSIASGSLPGGLSLSSSGSITGTPKTQGIFNFVVRATSSTGHTADSGTIQIVVYPPGNRMTSDAGAKTRLTSAKRYVAPNASTTNADGQTVVADSQGYTPLTMMRRYNGTAWVNITNNT